MDASPSTPLVAMEDGLDSEVERALMNSRKVESCRDS